MNSWINTQISVFLDRLIRDEDNERFVFVRGNPARNIPNPIEDYLVAVTVGAAEYTCDDGALEDVPDEAYTHRLRLRIYAPTRSSGGDLADAAAALMRSVYRVDTGKIVSSMRLNDVGVDNSARTLYREIVLTCHFDVTENPYPVQLFCGVEALEGVCSVQIDEECGGYDVMEMLSVTPRATVNRHRRWRLNVAVYAESDAFCIPDSGNLTVRGYGWEYQFGNCRIESIRRHVADHGREKNLYRLTADSMTRSEV